MLPRSFWRTSCCSIVSSSLFFLCVFVLLLAPATESRKGGDHDLIESILSARELRYNPKKDRPEKGISECESPRTGEWKPCRDTPPGNELAPAPENDPVPLEDFDNHVMVSLNVGLKPFQPSMALSVSLVLTKYLNATTEEFLFHLRDRRLMEQRFLQQEEFDLTWIYTDSKLVSKAELCWWTYNTTYSCACAQKGSAVTDEQVLHNIGVTLNSHVDDAVDNGSILTWLIDEAGDKLANVSHGAIGDGLSPGTELRPGRPGMRDPTVSPDTDEEEPTYPDLLDAQGWDWRRYLGLGLFIWTVVGTILVTQIAARRKRRRTAKEEWGNLATEEGVDELLKTGWKVKGSQMEVYEKHKLGYRDDDSMLIGGFEQQEMFDVGAEITLTHPSSETTPETAKHGK